MENLEKEIDNALRYDPLVEAEKITGVSYKEDHSTSMLGLLLSLDHSKKKEALLEANRDTKLTNNLSDYLAIADDLGFEVALRDEFVSDHHPATTESYYILCHSDGILLAFDTYAGTRVNGGKFYYNWMPPNREEFYEKNIHVTSSGSWNLEDGDRFREVKEIDELIWAGDHDCREGLRFHINRLKEHGRFFNPWKIDPHLHLCHYMDWRVQSKMNIDAMISNSREITQERLTRLPLHVRHMVAVSIKDK